MSRTRVQVTTADGQFLQLNPTEWADLCSAVRQLAPAGAKSSSSSSPR